MIRVQLTGPERLRFNPKITSQLRSMENTVNKEIQHMQLELLIFGSTTFETITNK